MQNNPKTELHMHADPQMRIRLQLFWSIVTIIVFSTAKSLRSRCNFFHSHSNAIDLPNPFWLNVSFTSTTWTASHEEREKIRVIVRGRSGQAFYNHLEPKLFLQKNEWTIQWIGLKAATSIVGEHIFRKYIPFTQRRNLKILGYAEKKNDFELPRKFLLLRRMENLVRRILLWGKKLAFFNA